MKKIIAFFTLLLSMTLFAKDLKVKTSTKTPVVDEIFNLEISVNADQSDNAKVDFDVIGLEVISKSPGSYTSRTTYINGKYSSESSITYSYELMAKKPGFAYIRNIRAETKSKVFKHSSISLNVLKEARKAQPIFARAELSKTQAYVGESVIIRYYLYNKSNTPINSSDVKKFPKLGRLLKRYHQEKISPERVEINGELYTRRVIYTAQVFPQEARDYKIDPIIFRVSYSKASNSFNNFGFGLRLGRQSVKTVKSKPITLSVKGLPGDNVPNDFTGLVGEHSFNLKINKNRFIVNEPIEITLEVVGSGALETYEAPSLFKRDSIEEFEKNSELNLSSDFSANKTVQYTYLAREGISLDEKVISFSYFDPEDASFKSKKVKIDPIKVAGNGSKPLDAPNNVNPKEKLTKNNIETQLPDETIYTYKPILKMMSSYVYNSFEYLVVFGTAFILFLLYSLVIFINRRENSNNVIWYDINKKGFSYSTLHRLLSEINSDKTMIENIKSLNLSIKSEEYYINLVKKLEQSYNKESDKLYIKASKKHIRELSKRIEI